MDEPVDLQGLRNYIIAVKERKYFIKEETLITEDDLKVIYNLKKEFGNRSVDDCIEPCKYSSGGCSFTIKFICKDCTAIEKIFVSKTQLNKILSIEDNKFICSDCNVRKKNKEAEIKETKELEQKVDIEKRKIDDTNKYIENYLNINNSWVETCKIKDRIASISQSFYGSNHYVDFEKVEDCILNMEYYDFLKTPYWKAIAQYTKLKANFKCSLCASKEGLATHHKTYENHGKEHCNLQDLIVLCNDCHEKFHDKLKD